MHVDEYFTLNLVKYDLGFIIWKSLTTDCNPPLFYIIDHFSVMLFGADQVGQRLPSVIFGILLIPAVYWFGKEYRDENLGVLAAAAMATMGSMWYYSGFGRSYMLNCLLFTLFCVFYLRITRNNDSTKNWCGLTLLTILLAYSHLYTLIPSGILWLYLLYMKAERTITFGAIAGLALTPLYLLFQAILKERTVSRAVAKTAWNWYGITWDQILIWTPLEFFGFTSFIWIPLIVYGIWKKRSEPFVVMIALAFLSAYAGLILLSDTTPVFIRYVILFLPVLCTIGLTVILEFIEDDSSSLPKELRLRFMLLLLIIYIICTAAPFITGFYMAKGQLSPTGIVLI